MSAWGDVGSPEVLKKTILAIVVGIVLVIVGAVGAGIAAGVGNYILQVLNETGIIIPASANYVAPIESLTSSVLLILRTASRPPVFIGIILAVVWIVVALLKRYDSLSV